MNYLKYYFWVLVVMSWLGLHIWAAATGVAPAGVKQCLAPSKKPHKPRADSRRTLSNPNPFGVRLSPAILTLSDESFPVAVPNGLVLKVYALRLVYRALLVGCDVARFAAAPTALKRSWA